jgi:hypothetical protein
MYSACHNFLLAMALRAWSAYNQPRPMMCAGWGGGTCRGSFALPDTRWKIDLERAGEQKHAVRPRAGFDVEMMQRQVSVVHVRRPIGEDIWHLLNFMDAKSQINIRPAIFAIGRSGASDRGTTDSLVTGCVLEEVGTEAGTFFASEHEC